MDKASLEALKKLLKRVEPRSNTRNAAMARPGLPGGNPNGDPNNPKNSRPQYTKQQYAAARRGQKLYEKEAALNRKQQRADFRRQKALNKHEFNMQNAKWAAIKDAVLGLGAEGATAATPAGAGYATSSIIQAINGGANTQDDRGQGPDKQKDPDPTNKLYKAAKGREEE